MPYIAPAAHTFLRCLLASLRHYKHPHPITILKILFFSLLRVCMSFLFSTFTA